MVRYRGGERPLLLSNLPLSFGHVSRPLVENARLPVEFVLPGREGLLLLGRQLLGRRLLGGFDVQRLLSPRHRLLSVGQSRFSVCNRLFRSEDFLLAGRQSLLVLRRLRIRRLVRRISFLALPTPALNVDKAGRQFGFPQLQLFLLSDKLFLLIDAHA